jgi:hypothetical protein
VEVGLFAVFCTQVQKSSHESVLEVVEVWKYHPSCGPRTWKRHDGILLETLKTLVLGPLLVPSSRFTCAPRREFKQRLLR